MREQCSLQFINLSSHRLVLKRSKLFFYFFFFMIWAKSVNLYYWIVDGSLHEDYLTFLGLWGKRNSLLMCCCFFYIFFLLKHQEYIHCSSWNMITICQRCLHSPLLWQYKHCHDGKSQRHLCGWKILKYSWPYILTLRRRFRMQCIITCLPKAISLFTVANSYKLYNKIIKIYKQMFTYLSRREERREYLFSL